MCSYGANSFLDWYLDAYLLTLWMGRPVSSNLLTEEMESLLICSRLKSLVFLGRNAWKYIFLSVLDTTDAVQFVGIFQVEYTRVSR